MDLTRTRPRPGRRLGWSADDLARYPYAHHWNPSMPPIAEHAVRALAIGPVAEPLLAKDDVLSAARDLPVPNGYTVTTAGEMRIAVVTEMPGVSPAMIDWWFGWHGDAAERYKLWHPQAHVHAEWAATPPEGSAGRERYVGQTSLVDEYVGAGLGRFAISFRSPADVGVVDPAVEGGIDATAVCARVGLVDIPLDVGWLVHLVDAVPGGSVMRSFFWIGLPHAQGRNRLVDAAVPVVGRFASPSEADARALLSHCAQEMTHLATFLPALHAEQTG